MKTKGKFSVTQLGLPLFILGLGVVIFLKVMENRSVHQLVTKNTDLLVQWELQTRLQQLEKDVTAIDASMRELVDEANQSNNEKQLSLIKQKENVASQIIAIQGFEEGRKKIILNMTSS
jgi:hypothetical protein